MKWGRVLTWDLLKYSWGFLHFNLPLLKRWLCFPAWQPFRKELFPPCRVQLSRTNLEWKPLRPPELFIIHKCCKPASRIHLDRLFFLRVQFLISLHSARKEAGSKDFLQEWSVKMGFVWIRKCPKFWRLWLL